jgi:hypothetical protein
MGCIWTCLPGAITSSSSERFSAGFGDDGRSLVDLDRHQPRHPFRKRGGIRSTSLSLVECVPGGRQWGLPGNASAGAAWTLAAHAPPRPNADTSANAKTWLRRRAMTHRHDLLANPGVTGVPHRLVRARLEGGRLVSVLRFEMSREPGAAATGFDIRHHHRRRRATRPASALEAPGRGPVQAGSINTSWAASRQTELA